MNCLDGHGEMLVRQVFDVQIDHCADCGGTWLDKGELARSAHAPPALETALRERIVVGVADAARVCPRCAVSLRRAHLDGVPLSQCALCTGLWFDADALERVQEWLRAGRSSRSPGESKLMGTAVVVDGLDLTDGLLVNRSRRGLVADTVGEFFGEVFSRLLGFD